MRARRDGTAMRQVKLGGGERRLFHPSGGSGGINTPFLFIATRHMSGRPPPSRGGNRYAEMTSGRYFEPKGFICTEIYDLYLAMNVPQETLFH